MIVKSLLRLGAYLKREGDRLLAPHGLTQQRFIVLKEIQERGPLSQKDICSALLYEKSNVSRIVGKLEAEGFIRRALSRGDGRLDILSIMGRGKRVTGLAMARLDAWNRRWLGPLSDSEVEDAAAALELLEGIRKNI